MFIDAVFTIARKSRQPKCPYNDEWITKYCTCVLWKTIQIKNEICK